MDKIINYLLLTIIFVFDPLAISLVVAANFAFEQLKPKKEVMEEEWDEERMNIIGQNGNDGIHYEQEEEQKPLEVYGEKPAVQQEIEKLEQKKGRLSSWGGKKVQKQINKLKSQLDNPDQINYF